MGATLTPAEAHILKALGGRRWTIKRLTPAAVKEAESTWGDLRAAAGFACSGGWLTTNVTNPKFGKAGLPTIGVTIHAATNALPVWKGLTEDERKAFASALRLEVSEVTAGLLRTVCPRSTAGCTGACVVAHSVNGRNIRSQRARLARHLLLMFRPAEAFTLTAHELENRRREFGRRGARWRVNVSDDLRLELLAPGLFSAAPRAYTYTKFSPVERLGRSDFRIVYSASERTTDADIIKWCADGHRVAVVFDVKRGCPLPATWNGITVVDGDLTDDLWVHPAGSVVGLRAKGTLAARSMMRARGFARPAVPEAAPAGGIAIALPVRKVLVPIAA
jgi:hypothetical protein